MERGQLIQVFGFGREKDLCNIGITVMWHVLNATEEACIMLYKDEDWSKDRSLRDPTQQGSWGRHIIVDTNIKISISQIRMKAMSGIPTQLCNLSSKMARLMVSMAAVKISRIMEYLPLSACIRMSLVALSNTVSVLCLWRKPDSTNFKSCSVTTFSRILD